MNNIFKKTKISLCVIMLVSFSIISCNQNNSIKNNNTNTSEGLTDTLLQSKDDLLVGISKAICYSGFRDGQHPDRGSGAVNPSYENTLEDLNILLKAGFKLIRVYDSGENSEMVLNVIKENNLDIKVLLGMWLDAEISNHDGCPWLTKPISKETLQINKTKNAQELTRGIKLANAYPEIVVAVNVGNEALVDWNDHMVEVDTMISYVKKVKNSIIQPVSVADNYDWWAKKGASLAKEVDFLAIHIYPVWVGKDINEGLSHSIENIMEVRRALPDSKIVITEAGWATIASEFGDRASEEKQKKYYSEIMNWAAEKNYTLFFFEAFDEPWKGNPDNPLGAEKHWGIWNVDRTPKLVMQK